jgi:hypothetical protein
MCSGALPDWMEKGGHPWMQWLGRTLVHLWLPWTRGSRRAAISLSKNRAARLEIAEDHHSDSTAMPALSSGFPSVSGGLLSSREDSEHRIAEFTRQRSQVRYLSRPPGKTPSLDLRVAPAVSTSSASAWLWRLRRCSSPWLRAAGV